MFFTTFSNLLHIYNRNSTIYTIMKRTIKLTESRLRGMIQEAVKMAIMESSVPTREAAIDYVRQNKTWSDAQEAYALENIDHYRCSIEMADEGIANKIMELLTEFAEENGMDEDWVWDNFTADDVFFAL